MHHRNLFIEIRNHQAHILVVQGCLLSHDMLYASGLEDRNVLSENETCCLCYKVYCGQNKTNTTVGKIGRRAGNGGDHPKHGGHGVFPAEQRGLYDVWLLGGPRGGTTGVYEGKSQRFTRETAIMYLCTSTLDLCVYSTSLSFTYVMRC